MNAVDTNILVYSFDDREPWKHHRALELLDELRLQLKTILLWQVAGEFLNQLDRFERDELITREKADFDYAKIRRLFPLAIPEPEILDVAINLRSRYSLSHWDSMLVAA